MEKTKTQVKYRMPHEVVGAEIIALFEGKEPLCIVELFDELGNLIVSNVEAELRRRGASFVAIDVEKDLADDMLAKHRVTGEDNPFKKTRTSPKTRQAIERYKVQGIVNVKDWQAVVDRRRGKHGGIETGWKANEKRANGIENASEDSTVVCKKTLKSGETRWYINYLVFRYLSERTVTDETGQPIDSAWLDGFMKQSKAMKADSREREAEKHGMDVRFDPQIRQIKMHNIDELHIENRVFVPIVSTTTA